MLRDLFSTSMGARWWHFWNPGSGLGGGIICAMLILGVIHLLGWLIQT